MAIMLFIPTVVFGATFGGGEDYTIPASEVVEGNHYAAGANVNVDAEIKGDLIAAGGNIYINNAVKKDAILAGGNLFIYNEIGEDLRIGGGNINIFSTIKGELLAGGGLIKIGSKAIIEKDVHVGGGQVYVDGQLKGNLTLGADEAYINGTIDGDVFIDAPVIKFGEKAKIAGDLHYRNAARLENLSAVVAGEVTFEEVVRNYEKKHKDILPGLIGGMMFYRFLTMLVLAFVIFAIFRKYTKHTVEQSIEKFGMSLLLGLVVVIVTPIISVLLLITLIGLPFTIIAIAYAVILSVLGKTLAAMILGTLVFKIFKRKNIVNWWTILVGVILMNIVILIPFLGWIFALVLFLVAIGVMFTQTVDALKRLR